MKRVITAILSMSLVFSLTVPALAADTIKEQVNEQGQEQTATQASGTMANFQAVDTYTGFQDVATSDWFYGAVKTCYELDLMKGNSTTTFNPKGNVTVAQVVTMASRVHKIYQEGKGDFESVGSTWYQVYVDYALEQGIIKSGDFSDYTRAATRAEMAYVFAGALPVGEYNSINTITELPDVDGSTKYSTAIFSLYNAGIVAGSDKYGTFNPNSNISRAEAAAIINRVAVKSERKTLTLETPPVNQTWNEGQSHSEPKVGDTVIKADGTKVVLKEDYGGVLGAGQGVDIYTGTVINGVTAKEGMTSWFDGMCFKKDSITGEMHTAQQWITIYTATYPKGLVGEYDGEVYNTWHVWDASFGDWDWRGPGFD